LSFATRANGSAVAEAMRIDSAGNVGIGTSSPSSRLTVSGGSLGSGTNDLFVSSGLTTGRTGTYDSGKLSSIHTYYDSTAIEMAAGISSGYVSGVSVTANSSGTYTGTVRFLTASAERMRIDSSGNLCLGTNSSLNSAILSISTSVANQIGYLNNSNAAPYGLRVSYGTATPNGTDNWFYYASDATALRFKVNSNGGIANYSANNVSLSDQREKKDIELAPNYLDKVCAIPVKTFLFNDQGNADKNLGVIAQDVQAVCPELVMESNWGTEEEPKMRLSIYQTDLQYALMKSIQELKAINDTQAETINALTARIVALESK
jgi:hypothetical protein